MIYKFSSDVAVLKSELKPRNNSCMNGEINDNFFTFILIAPSNMFLYETYYYVYIFSRPDFVLGKSPPYKVWSRNSNGLWWSLQTTKILTHGTIYCIFFERSYWILPCAETIVVCCRCKRQKLPVSQKFPNVGVCNNHTLNMLL